MISFNVQCSIPGITETASPNRPVHGIYMHSEGAPDYGGKVRKQDTCQTVGTEICFVTSKAQPASYEPRRIQVDIEQARALVLKLDKEKRVNGNDLSNKDYNKLKGVELLDTLTAYLWQIHGLDYYGMSETDDFYGFRHVMATGNTRTGCDINGDDWEKQRDSYWQKRLSGHDPLEILKAKDEIDASIVKVLGDFVRKTKDANDGLEYGCRIIGCNKVFLSFKNVIVHWQLWHTQLLADLASKICDEVYFQNYMK